MAACKACCKVRGTKFRVSDEGRETNRRWRKDNLDRLNQKRRERYAADPEHKQAQNRAWREQNPEKVLAYAKKYRLQKYGLTTEDYDRMLAEQDGKCAICSTTERWMVVDHDHETGKVRGILCYQCNGALGMIGDHNMHAALEYLQRAEVSR